MCLVDSLVRALKLCMLMSSIALQVLQAVNKVLARHPKLAWLLDEKARLIVSETGCAHINVDLFHLRIFLDL